MQQTAGAVFQSLRPFCRIGKTGQAGSSLLHKETPETLEVSGFVGCGDRI